jgi:hypothetical protein
VKNPFPDEAVNFLHIGINDERGNLVVTPTLCALTLATKNKLTCGDDIAAHIKAGVYDSRTDDSVRLTGNCSHIFAYVINGSFEVEGRLMEYRDGLLLWETEVVAFEALSETAIILFIEYTIKIKENYGKN